MDKDKEMLRLASNVLKEENYDVMIAADGNSAIHSLETFNPDVIILDIEMPELDGVHPFYVVFELEFLHMELIILVVAHHKLDKNRRKGKG